MLPCLPPCSPSASTLSCLPPCSPSASTLPCLPPCLEQQDKGEGKHALSARPTLTSTGLYYYGIIINLLLLLLPYFGIVVTSVTHPPFNSINSINHMGLASASTVRCIQCEVADEYH